YDNAFGGHFRIELRALPAGPTVADMVASTAFLLGLTYAVAADIDRYLAAMSFGHTRRNFYCAATNGLDAELLWPSERPPSPELFTARDLLPRLVGLAREGLLAHGVARDEADAHLEVFLRRVE